MKVLILSTGIFKRQYGQQRYEFNFLNTLFLYYPDIYFRAIFLNDDRIEAPFSELNKKIKFVTCGRRIRLLSKIKFVISCLFYALKERPDFLICGHTNLCILAFFIHKIIFCPYIIITHGTDSWKLKGYFKKCAFISAKIILSVSNYTASKITEQISSVKKNIYILANSVDVNRFFPKEKSLHLLKKYELSGYRVILTVARLDIYDRHKGYDKVILALPEVLKIIPNVKYILVGEGNDIAYIKRLITDLGLESKVILTGYISDDKLADYYNLCDLFIMPSKQEGFGIVFLEALACGKPVIAGNRDASKEALLDGRLGILIDPDDVKTISKKIIEVLNKEVSKELVEPGYLRSQIIQNFSKEIFIKKAKILFDETIFNR